MTVAEYLPKLKLTCLGVPEVQVDGLEPPPDVLWRKHHALFVYLAFSPGRERSREHLMGVLWPDKPQEKARHSLNEAVRRLRAGLGAGRLISQGDSIGLASESLESDVEQFEDSARTHPVSAIEKVKGEFLEGFSVDDAPAFERWISVQRTRINGLVTSCLLAQGEDALVANRFSEASDAAKKALRLNAFLEPAANLAMRAYALSGDATSALATFHEFAEQVNAEIGEAPGRELGALSERIRSGRWQVVSSPRSLGDPPLVGRASVTEEAFRLVEDAIKSGPQVLVLVSDPGMGKTRILNDCVKRAALAGAIVSIARPMASDHDAPWSSLALILEGGLGSAPGLVAADMNALSTLAAVSPKLAERFEPATPKDTAHVASALESVLRSISDEQPIVIALDDAHLADGHSIEVLGAVIKRFRQAPIAFLLATDGSTERCSVELAQLRASVGRDLSGCSCRLAPLKLEHVSDLVQKTASWCASSEESDRLTRRLHYESGGSPFLAVTLLHGLERAPTLKEDLLAWPRPKATFESPLPFSIPDLARLAILARISDLDNRSLKVLRAASIGGIALDLPLIELLTEVTDTELNDALDTLERHRFLVFDGVRYAFAAPLFAQVIRGECLTHGQRQRLRKAAIRALSGRSELESRVLRVELMAKAGLDGDAFAEAVTVAQFALDLGANRTARRAVFAAERAARDPDDEKRSTLEKLQVSLASQ